MAYLSLFFRPHPKIDLLASAFKPPSDPSSDPFRGERFTVLSITEEIEGDGEKEREREKEKERKRGSNQVGVSINLDELRIGPLEGV